MKNIDMVKKAIRHQSGPVPYAIHLTGEAYELYGEALLKDYYDPQVAADYKEGRISLQQAVSLAIGNKAIYVYGPWWDWTNLTDEFLVNEDPPKRLPDTIGHGSYEAFFEQSAYIKEHYDVYQILTIWGSHWEKAYFARGIEHFLADLAADPEWAEALLDMIIRKNIVMLENLLPSKTFDGVLLGSDWGTQRDLIMSPRTWHTMIEPGEKQEYDLVHRYGKDVWVHSCGDVQKLMPSLCDLGVDVLNPVQPECMPLDFLKKEYGNHITWYGGISTQHVLPYGTPEEVRKVTFDTISLMAENGGYITAPSQEIQTDVPYENLRALIDAAKQAAKE